MHSKKITLEEFMKLDQKQALNFDFLTQGDEPDRTKLTNSIYNEIFPWYASEKHAGDTLNTYRIAVKHFYGKYYRFLDRDKQLEILDIIKRNTDHDEGFLFEFEDIDNNGNKYYQLSNNYQLGNFGILPISGGINPARAQAPYYDFFDRYLLVIGDFYADSLEKTDKLTTAIFQQREYFEAFNGIDNFLEVNGLNDFIEVGVNEDGSEEYFVVGLSTAENFEEYVKAVMEIVKSRGEQMWNILHEIATSESESLIQELDETQLKINKLKLFVEKYDEGEEIKKRYKKQINVVDEDSEMKIDQENNNVLNNPLEWFRWWFWPILFIVIMFLFMYINNKYANNSLANPWVIRRKISTISHFTYLIFWIALISKIVYNFKFSNKLKVFKAVKQNKIDNLENNKKKNHEQLVEELDEEYKKFSDKNENELSYKNLVYEKFNNRNDIVELIGIIRNGRADDFKEAYEILENQKHRESLEVEARRRSEAEEATQRSTEQANREALWLQKEAAEAKIRTDERSAQAAENMTYETERHNREVEDRWKKS